MPTLAKILKIIFVVLFVEAILFAPVVLMVAIGGKEIVRTMKYAVPLLVAVMPYIIWKRIRPTISGDRRSIVFYIASDVQLCGTSAVLSSVECSGEISWLTGSPINPAPGDLYVTVAFTL